MTKPFFDRRVEKRSLSGAKTRLFKEVYRKMAKSDGKFIFFSFLSYSKLINFVKNCSFELYITSIYTATADELLIKMMGTNSQSKEFKKEREEIDILFNETKLEEAAIKLEALKSKIQSSP